jgi:hypothetical protein
MTSVKKLISFDKFYGLAELVARLSPVPRILDTNPGSYLKEVSVKFGLWAC